MMFTIKTDSIVNFKRLLLVSLLGVIELHSLGTFSYQDLWSAIRFFYPKNKVSNFDIDDELKNIFGLISEIDTVKNEFPNIYPKALDQIRILIKNYLEQYPIPERDELGYLRLYITVDT